MSGTPSPSSPAATTPVSRPRRIRSGSWRSATPRCPWTRCSRPWETTAAGGTALFVGTVRSHDNGADVDGLGYSAHPTAEAEMRRIAEKVIADFPVRALAAVHRVGDLRIGDLAVVVAVSCPHRGEAFEACRKLIDDLKHEVPIWKHQTFSDGTEEWVGA